MSAGGKKNLKKLKKQRSLAESEWEKSGEKRFVANVPEASLPTGFIIQECASNYLYILTNSAAE